MTTTLENSPIYQSEHGSLEGLPSGDFIRDEDVQALREYFTAEADFELGRWRYDNQFVVYPIKDMPDSVWVLNEAEPGILAFDRDSIYTQGEYGNAATAYFKAHPEPKPEWQNAVHEEVWELTVNGDTGPFLAFNGFAGPDGQCIFFRAANGSSVRATSDEVTAGHRIYPPAD